MKKELEVYDLNDGKEYLLIDEDIINNIKYSFFVNANDDSDICFKKTILENDIEYFTGLDDDNEFNKVLLHFTKKNLK